MRVNKGKIGLLPLASFMSINLYSTGARYSSLVLLVTVVTGWYNFRLLAYLGPTAPLCSPFGYGKVSELVGGEDPYVKTAVFFQFQLNSCSEGHMASCLEGHFLSIVFGRTH